MSRHTVPATEATPVAPTIALTALITLSSLSPAEGAELRVPLRGQEALVLQVPEGWPAEVRRVRADLPPLIALGSPHASGFKVLITPFWPAPGAGAPTPQSLRSFTEGAARQAATQSVERELPLRAFTGPGRSGYYFAATDRAPRPGGYTHLTQGAIGYGDLRLMFTILANDQPEAVVTQAMTVLRTLQRVRGTPAD